MNILMITQMYSQPDDIGANKPTKTVNYFAKEWYKSGHKVVVIHCSSKFPVVYYLLPSCIKDKYSGRISTMTPPIASRRRIHHNENGVDVHRIPMFKVFPGHAYPRFMIKMQTNAITKTLRDASFIPEIVMGHFANPSAELVKNLSKYYKSMSSIVFHHDCTQKSIIKYRLSNSLKEINAIGARSSVEAQSIKSCLKLKYTPFVCCSGVPNDVIEDAEKRCSKMDFSSGIKHIFVGSLTKNKNVDVTIDAFIETKQALDEMLIIGGGPEEARIKKIVIEKDKNTSITLAGRIARNEVFQRMKESHILTLVSRREVYGMVYIEAMLQGCLVIASKGEGFDGIIVDGVNGFLCNAGDKEMLKQIYWRIQAMSIDERNRIGQAAIDTAIHYSEKEVAERYLNDVITHQKKDV